MFQKFSLTSLFAVACMTIAHMSNAMDKHCPNLLFCLTAGDLSKAKYDSFLSIQRAVREGTIEIIQKYLSAGRNVDKQSSITGDTLLHDAAFFGKEEVAKLLLTTYKANVNATNQYGETPLHKAASRQHVSLVGLLLAYQAHVDACDNNGTTPLCCAIGGGREDTQVVRLLLENKADPNKAESGLGHTPLHKASIDGNREFCELLLRYKANIYAQDKFGKQPLFYAQVNNRTHVIDLLMNAMH